MTTNTRLYSSRENNWHRTASLPYRILSRYGYVREPRAGRAQVLSITSVIPRDFSTIIKLLAVVLIMLSFIYGYLVNKTVSITSEYSAVEEKLDLANGRLSEVSTMVADAELTLDKYQSDSELLTEADPTGFVSRDVTTGFTYNHASDS